MKLVFIFAFSVFLVVNPSEAMLPFCLHEVAGFLHGKDLALQSIKSDLELMKQDVKLAITSRWPTGHYCFLASGDCPAGFTRHEGNMRALGQKGGNTDFISPATFGDSKIQCYGNCGQYHPWNGELYITACCK